MPNVAITGGPGVGKTTLLSVLRARGLCVVDESARAVIAERISKGICPRPPPDEFAREVLRRDLAACESNRSATGWVLFDRGLVDGLGLAYEVNELRADQVQALLAGHPFHSVGFILPPWREIYRTDAERDQSFEDCQRIHTSILDWYKRCGIELLEIPRGTVEQRVARVLQTLQLRAFQGAPRTVCVDAPTLSTSAVVDP